MDMNKGRFAAATTADLLATAAEYARDTAGLVDAMEYGTAVPIVGFMGDLRLSVVAEDGATFTLSFERASSRYLVGTAVNGGKTYLKGTAALMARDAFKANHPAFA